MIYVAVIVAALCGCWYASIDRNSSVNYACSRVLSFAISEQKPTVVIDC
jgi:hypothetical protein